MYRASATVSYAAVSENETEKEYRFSVIENREGRGREEGKGEEEEERNLIRLESIDGFGEVLNHVVRESEETLVASAAWPKCQQSVSLPESHLVSSSDRGGLAFQWRYSRQALRSQQSLLRARFSTSPASLALLGSHSSVRAGRQRFIWPSESKALPPISQLFRVSSFCVVFV